MIIEAATTVVTGLGSMLLAVGGLGGAMFAGAWLLARDTPCNPYGYGACACGCGTDCEELPDG